MKNCVTIMTLLLLNFSAYNQNKYYPQGNPDKLQVQVTVPLWLPWVSGQIGLDGMVKDVESDLNATPADILGKLKGALMLNADISKGHFVGFVNYLHILLSTNEKQVMPPGKQPYSWSADIRNDALDLCAGGRLYFPKGMVDPFVGVHYYGLHNTLWVKDSAGSKTKEGNIDFWDPFFGVRAFYYPKERWMIFLRTDFGGIIDNGPEVSYNLEFRSGYTLSPTIDVFAGFRSTRVKYASYTEGARVFYMSPNYYGFEIGLSCFIPAREKNKRVFPHIK